LPSSVSNAAPRQYPVRPSALRAPRTGCGVRNPTARIKSESEVKPLIMFKRFRQLFQRSTLTALNITAARIPWTPPPRTEVESGGGWYRSDVSDGRAVRFAVCARWRGENRDRWFSGVQGAQHAGTFGVGSSKPQNGQVKREGGHKRRWKTLGSKGVLPAEGVGLYRDGVWQRHILPPHQSGGKLSGTRPWYAGGIHYRKRCEATKTGPECQAVLMRQ